MHGQEPLLKNYCRNLHAIQNQMVTELSAPGLMQKVPKCTEAFMHMWVSSNHSKCCLTRRAIHADTTHAQHLSNLIVGITNNSNSFTLTHSCKHMLPDAVTERHKSVHFIGAALASLVAVACPLVDRQGVAAPLEACQEEACLHITRCFVSTTTLSSWR